MRKGFESREMRFLIKKPDFSFMALERCMNASAAAVTFPRAHHTYGSASSKSLHVNLGYLIEIDYLNVQTKSP